MQNDSLKYKIIFTLIFFAGIFLLPKISWAATYYVDFINGSNNNSGSQSQPWKTPPGTVNDSGTGWLKINGGDTIYLKGGQTFPISIDVYNSYYNNGSAGNYVIFRSGHLSSPVWGSTSQAEIDGGNATRKFGFYVYGIQFVKIEGFEIFGQGGDPSVGIHQGDGPSGIEFNGGANYPWVVDNYIHDVTHTGANGAYGIEIGHSSNALIEKNITDNNSEKGIEIYGLSDAGDAVIRLNVVRYNGEHGIVISAPNAKVYRNLIYHNADDESGSGANIKADDGSSVEIYNNAIYQANGWNVQILGNSQNCKIYNNTLYDGYYFFGGDYYGTNIQIYGSGTTGCEIKNNIIYYYGKGANSLYFQIVYRPPLPTAPNYQMENNIIYGVNATDKVILYGNRDVGSNFYTIGGFQNAYSWANGNIQADPGLNGGSGASVSNLPTGFNSDWTLNNSGLQIKSTSQAKEGGLDLGSSYNFDIIGISRPQGSAWDIGAHEYVGAGDTTPPTAPSGVVVS